MIFNLTDFLLTNHFKMEVVCHMVWNKIGFNVSNNIKKVDKSYKICKAGEEGTQFAQTCTMILTKFGL